MSESRQLFSTLKNQLKARNLTYRDIAAYLEITESSVKRIFARGDISVERLIKLCALMDMTLAELTKLATTSQPRLSRLSDEQEKALIADKKLLLVATCVLNHWTLKEIITHYRLTKAECLQYLIRLERMRLIEVQPDNRIRIVVSRDFEWIRGGPIEQYFSHHYRDEFLNNDFSDEESSVFFVHGMLTTSARQIFLRQLKKLRRQFADLHEESTQAKLGERHGTGMLLALRTWEPDYFIQLRRNSDNKEEQ